MVLLLSAFTGMESLSHGKILGMTISFLGIALLLIEQPAQGSGANWLGDLIVIAAGAFFAYYTILVKKSAHRYDALTSNALVFDEARRMKELVFVDGRSATGLARIPLQVRDAIHVSAKNLDQALRQLPRDRALVTYRS